MASRIDISIKGGLFVFDKKALRSVMRGAGAEIKATAVDLIRSSAASGRTYGKHRASSAGQPPASDTGKLAKSIKVKLSRSAMSTSVVDTAPYALALEAGSVGGGGAVKGSRNTISRKGRVRKVLQASTSRQMAARPFLSLALSQDAKRLGERVATALRKGISFKETK